MKDHVRAVRRSPRDRLRVGDVRADRLDLRSEFSGRGGTLTSSSVSRSIGRPLSAPSATRRAVSLRPIIPRRAGDQNVHGFP